MEFRLRCILLLVIVCTVAGQSFEEDEDYNEGLRSPRGLIVSRQAPPAFAGQRNSLCTATNGDAGSCHSRRLCRFGRGTVSNGQCGFASGICCTKILGGNETTTLKRVILRRVGGATGNQYQYTIQAANPRVCQLRIDFRTLSLAQPTAVAQVPAVGTLMLTTCTTESMTIDGNVFCGVSTQQHVYVQLSTALNPSVVIRATVTANSNSNWDILATQLECQPGRPTISGTQTRSNSWSYTKEDRLEEFDYEDRASQNRPRITAANDAFLVAPRGCLQYFPNTTGVVKSFNFDGPTQQYVPSMNYAICFNQPNNVTLNLVFTTFDVYSRLTTATTPARTAQPSTIIDSNCVWSGTTTAPMNILTQDYLLIPRAQLLATTSQSYFCGTDLSNMAFNYNNSPLVMRFLADNLIDRTANQAELGWSFTYRQQ